MTEYSDNLIPDVGVVDGLKVAVDEVAQEYINNLENPAEIYENNGLFVDMIKYIYKVYIGDVIGNNKKNTYGFKYDYDLLDKIFDIYTSLVYKYKQNKRPSILEFCLFVNISRQAIYNIIHNGNKQVTPAQVDRVKSWFLECENQLTNGSSVFEIFLLKSQYRYNDNLSPVPIESRGPALIASELPDLSTCQNAISGPKDPKKDKDKQS